MAAGIATVQQNQTSEQDAFLRDLAAVLPSLKAHALRYTRNAGRADDLVQDTVVRALRFRSSFQAGTSLRAWTHTILTNAFLHDYRRKQKERQILEGSARSDVEELLRSQASYVQARQTEQDLFGDVLSDDVVKALAELPEIFRMVVVLCDLQGKSYREVAAVLGCPAGTVMSRLYRGRRQLGRSLKGLAQSYGIGRVAA